MNKMRILGDMFQSVSVMLGAWFVYLYYKERVACKGLEEKVRREHADKRGGFLLVALSALMFFFGTILFAISLLHFFYYV